MGRAYRGPYARPSSTLSPYATATVWGTGVDPIHSYYGEGPPLRVTGRRDAMGALASASGETLSGERDYQNPADSSGFDPPESVTWGYPIEYDPDSFGMGADSAISVGDTAPPIMSYMDDRPSWDTPVENQRVRSSASNMPPWGTGGKIMRAIRAGAARYRLYEEPGGHYAPITAEQPNSYPTETVSEGWINKTTSFVADANPSAPSQYEVQTSMRQRYGVRDNQRAMMRCTDDERAKIDSRVEAMIDKVYSTGERLYDMFPYQIDQIERPFRYRTAGVGRADWLIPNEYSAVSPVQRTPPADPSVGVPEVGADSQYGYTGEDSMYYG
jgi:hypothetical protein